MSCEKCGMLACVCSLEARHAADCRFRVAAACAVGVECEHGYDVCPTCDPCTCSAGVAAADFSTVPPS